MSARTKPIVSIFCCIFPFIFAACDPQTAPTRQTLVAKYPAVEQGSARPENKKVICPFHRMLERSGIYDEEIMPQTALTVPTQSVTDASLEFGCATNSCGPVATAVDLAQSGSGIDLLRLHQANGISHQCGLTFAPGGSEVSDAVRDATLARLQTLADANGHLSFSNLMLVKQEICASQGLTMNAIEESEIRLIYAYLAGVDNGFILLSDVDRLLHATMPVNKTTQWVDSALLARVR